MQVIAEVLGEDLTAALGDAVMDLAASKPGRGQALSPNNPRLCALEAYVIAQRNGTPLAYGKH